MGMRSDLFYLVMFQSAGLLTLRTTVCRLTALYRFAAMLLRARSVSIAAAFSISLGIKSDDHYQRCCGILVGMSLNEVVHFMNPESGYDKAST